MVRTDPYKKIKTWINPPIPRSEFRVFVFGPALNPEDEVAKPASLPDSPDIIEHAKYLRYLTKKKIEGAGFPVDFGETPKMLEFWNDHYGAGDPGSAELCHAEFVCGAIIIYPSSVGSLCELGMFSTLKNICSKCLAIVHTKYKKDNSFFTNALLEVFLSNNGRREFENYTDHESCVAICLSHVAGRYNSLLRDHNLIEQAKIMKLNYERTAHKFSK